jgi:opacity protein-like surface antigen
MTNMKMTWSVLSVVVLSLGLAGVAQAEFYIAGQAGYSMPNDFENVQGRNSSGTVTDQATDLEMESSILYGGKVGYFFDSLQWIGIEAEAFTVRPDLKQQTFTRTTTTPLGTISVQDQIRPNELRVTTAALNLIFRVPGKRFEPYAGGGIGMYWAKFSSDATNATGQRIGEASDTTIGMNFLAGARLYLFKQLALFGEYKYTAANFDFGGQVLLKGDYSAHNFVGGLSIHFK